jgi:hypothetical protein
MTKTLLDELIQVGKVDLGCLVVEISAHWYQEVRRPVVALVLVHLCSKSLNLEKPVVLSSRFVSSYLSF